MSSNSQVFGRTAFVHHSARLLPAVLTSATALLSSLVAPAQSPVPPVDVLVAYTQAAADQVGGAATVATQAAGEIATMNEMFVEYLRSDGGPVSTTYRVPASAASTCRSFWSPGSGITKFGVIAESVTNGSARPIPTPRNAMHGEAAKIVVERASYRNRGDVRWMAGNLQH